MDPVVLLASAETEASLAAERARLASLLESGAALAALARESRGRPAGLHRAAIVARDAALAAQALRGARSEDLFTAVAKPDPRVVFMYPGLGDHRPQMGRGLFDRCAPFREALAAAAEHLRPTLGADLVDEIYPGPAPQEASGGGFDLRAMLGDRGGTPAGRLAETWFAQPATFAVELALTRLWAALGVRPHALIGYSLGEYAAAWCAEVLSLEDTLDVVARRARMIHALPAGAMLAIGLPAAEVAPLLPETVSLSALNGAAMTVVAGVPDAVAEVEATFRAQGAGVRRVATSHAFHSAMMKPIAAAVQDLYAPIARRPPRIPYASNVTGALITAEQALDAGYWARHLVEPVRFFEGLDALVEHGADIFLEVGPGQNLRSLVLQHERAAAAGIAIPSMKHAFERRTDLDVLLDAAARLWAAGVAIDWRALDAVDTRSEEGPTVTAAPVPPPTPAADPEVARKIAEAYAKVLRRQDVAPNDNFLELGGDSLIATQLAYRLKKALGVTLPLRRLFEHPTPSALAAFLAGGTSGKPAAQATSRTVTLPGGLTVEVLNEAEAHHFHRDIFEEQVYLQHGGELPEAPIVLDAGANAGLFTLFLARLRPNARIVAFEPIPAVFELLRRNTERHGVKATLVQAGLASRPGRARFTFYPRSTGMSSMFADAAEERAVLSAIVENQAKEGQDVSAILDNREEFLDERFSAVEVECRLTTVSEAIRGEGLDRVDLLKIDVQKAELAVLEGIEDADWPKIRRIAGEIHDLDGRLEKMQAILRDRGFEVAAAQDPLYRGTVMHNFWAWRPRA